jgi:hypothetical protein
VQLIESKLADKCIINEITMILWYQMSGKKVKPDSAPDGSEAGDTSEPLRLLARMIARRLLTKRQGMDEQCPSARGPDT